MKTIDIPLAQIRTDGGTQPRECLAELFIEELAGHLRDGATLPPLTVFYDGDRYWLADGFHRLAAYAKEGWGHVECEVRQGTQRDAILYSCTEANKDQNSLRRTNQDKRRAVERLLADAEWAKWSDHEIAKRCGVSHPFVASCRGVTGNVTSERAFTTKHGTESTMKTENIGRKKSVEVVNEDTGEVIENAAILTTTTAEKAERATQSNALEIAGNAIDLLKDIDSEDPHRSEAMESVVDWIQENA